MKKFLLGLLLLATSAFGQTAASRVDGQVTGPDGRPVHFPTIYVCTAGSTAGSGTTPCSPTLPALYSDWGSGSQTTISNPFQGDFNGNYHFYAPPGRVRVDVVVNGVVQSDTPDEIVSCELGATCSNGGGGGGSATSIQSNPVSAGAANKVGQGYFQNFANNALQLQTRAFVDAKWDCGLVGDGVTDDSAALNACITAHPGQKIAFPKTQAAGSPDYFFASTINYTGTTTTLEGMGGQCRGVTGNCVTLKWAVHTTGIDTGNNACQGCSIVNLHILGQEPSSTFTSSAADNILPCNPPGSQSYSASVVCVNTGDGVHVTSNFFTIRGSLIEKFGRHGVYVDGSGANCFGKCADNFHIETTNVDGNRGDGLYIAGGDTNAGSTMQVNGYYNALYCLEDDGFLGNSHYSPECHTNHVGTAAALASSNISNVVCAAGACTLTTATPVASAQVGSGFTIAGTTNFNGTFFAATVSSNIITFTNGVLTLAAETTGTARVASTANFWTAAGIATSGGGFFSNSVNNFRTWIQPYCEGDNTNWNLSFRNIVIGGVIGCPSVTNPPPFLWMAAPIPNTQLGFNNFNVGNNTDAELDMRLIGGLTTDQATQLIWADHTGTKNNWILGSGLLSANQHFIISDAHGGAGTSPFVSGCTGSVNCRLDFKTSAETFLNSGGTAAIQFNMQPNSGTGGVIWGSGGASPTQIGSVDASGNAIFNGSVTVNNSGPPTIAFTQTSACGNSTAGVNSICSDTGKFYASFGNTTKVQFWTDADSNTVNGVLKLNGSGFVAMSQMVSNTAACDATHVPNGNNTACIAVGGGSSGSTLLNFQGATSAIVGTAALADIYSFTIPANTIPAGKCVRVTTSWDHNVGAASPTYRWFWGAANIGGTPSNANANDTYWTLNLCNNPSVTNAQSFVHDILRLGATNAGNPGNGTAAVDTTSNQLIKVQFNVAATDQVTGKFFMVELLQ